MLPSACAGKCSQSVAIRLGHCYIQFVANQVSAADCPHCPLTVCRLRCALTELDLIYCARTRTSVLVYTCIAELVVPLGKARAIARAWISWVNSNFIFSFPDGSSHQTRRCAPLPSPHTPPSPPRPSPPPSLRHHHRHHRHRCLRASVVTVTLFVTATSPPPTPPSSPPPPPSPPGPYASAWQGAVATIAIAASAFPNPPTPRSPPSARRRPHHLHLHRHPLSPPPPSPPSPPPSPRLRRRRHSLRHHHITATHTALLAAATFLAARPILYASAWQGAIAASAIAASAFPNPPTRRSPPSTRRRPHHWHCHCLLRPQPHHRHPRTTTLAAITISSRPVMRNGRDARACPRHMRAPARSPALCTHSTPPALPGPHLAQHSPSFASLSGRSQCELSNEVRQVVWYVDFAWKMP